MSRYLVRRVLQGVMTLFGVVTLIFFLLHLTGDPAATLLPSDAAQADVDATRREFGLDRPLIVQYASFLAGLPRGDLGASYHLREPAAALVLERLPATVFLAVTALALALVLAIPLGLAAAHRKNSWIDYLTSGVSFVGFATPTFWLGTVAILVFAVGLRWFPTSGYGTIGHLVLPAGTLAAWAVSQLLLVLRADVLGVLNQDYIRTARAKGAPERRVLLRHAFRNASIGLVTLVGLTFGPLLAGAIVTETVFAWPGLGRLVVGAILNRDYPLVRAGVVYLAILIIAMNIVMDAVYTLLDPRIRVA